MSGFSESCCMRKWKVETLDTFHERKRRKKNGPASGTFLLPLLQAVKPALLPIKIRTKTAKN